jgi:tRNA nucleotidyltransferase/poly(A) polymerase
MSRRDAERNALTSELSQLTARVEEQEACLKEAETLRSQFQDLQHKYDALLQMYGEKVEEAQELHLDLEDVKEMYKTQVRWHRHHLRWSGKVYSNGEHIFLYLSLFYAPLQ